MVVPQELLIVSGNKLREENDDEYEVILLST